MILVGWIGRARVDVAGRQARNERMPIRRSDGRTRPIERDMTLLRILGLS